MSFLKFLVIILLPISWASESIEELSFFFEGKETKIPMVSFNGAEFNTDCTKSLKSCDAYKAYNGKPKKLKKDNSGSIALSYCKTLNSTPVLLKNKKDEEFAFCLFEDLSFVKAWDIYHKHWEEK